jgi:hypothetical protein
MSLLTEYQIKELTSVHDKWWAGEGIFQEYLIEWNKKQTSELLDALKETREHLDYISEWDMPIITKPVIDRCIAILEK